MVQLYYQTTNSSVNHNLAIAYGSKRLCAIQQACEKFALSESKLFQNHEEFVKEYFPMTILPLNFKQLDEKERDLMLSKEFKVKRTQYLQINLAMALEKTEFKQMTLQELNDFIEQLNKI